MPSQMGSIGEEFRIEPSSLKFNSVPPEMVDAVWLEMWPVIERALVRVEGDTGSAEVIKNEVKNGQSAMWVVSDERIVAVFIIKVLQRVSRKQVFVVMVAGSRMDEWLGQFHELLVDFAEIVGATEIKSQSRPGIIRAMKKYGWRERAVIMEYRR